MNKIISIILILTFVCSGLSILPNVAAADTHVDSDGWEWHYDTTLPHILTRIVQVGGANTNVTMPDTLDGTHPVTQIGYNCFQDVEGAKLTIFWHMPDTVTVINAGAFFGCVNLVYVDISAGLVELGQNAFVNTKISSITFPDTFTTYTAAAFGGTTPTYLSSVWLGNSLTSLPNNAFINCALIETLTLPDTVVSIGNSALQSMGGLKFLKIGSGLTTIGTNFLYNAVALEDVEFWGLVAPTIGSTPFSGINSAARGHAKPASNFPSSGAWNGLTMGYQIAPPAVPTNLMGGMINNAVHLTCDPIGGLFDAVAYYRSSDNVTFVYRQSELFDWYDSIGDVLYPTLYYKAQSANKYGFSEFCPTIAVDTLSELEQLGLYDMFDYPLVDDISGEPSIIMIDGTLHMWFASGPTLGESSPHYYTLWYTYATNDELDNFATPVKCTGYGLANSSRFPFVLTYNEKFYLFNSPIFNSDVYLWESSDKITWTALNGGNPVIRKSTDNSSIYYNIWNMGAVIVGDVWHLWLECGTQSSQIDVMTAYTWGTLENLDWSQHLREDTNGIQRSANVCPVYIPERNAIIIFAAKPDPVSYPGQPPTITYIGVYTVSLSSDLYNPNSYKLSPYFRIGNGEDVSDAHIAFTDGYGDFEFIIQYFSNDAARPHVYQIAGWLDRTQLYDYLVNGPTIQTTEHHISGFMDVISSGIIWLLIYFIVVIVLSAGLGKIGCVAGMIIMGLICGMSLPVGIIVSIFSIIGGVVILFGGDE